MKECLYQDENLQSCAKVKEPTISLTSTSSHETNCTRKTVTATTKHRRGYKHLPEVGNFSQFNEILKNNKNTLIKR